MYTRGYGPLSSMKHDDDPELQEALKIFLGRFRYYLEKVERRYRSYGDNDTDVVQGAWNTYLRLRKQRKGY